MGTYEYDIGVIGGGAVRAAPRRCLHLDRCAAYPRGEGGVQLLGACAVKQ